jgi:L-idonate 5-dehydrogenase
MILPSESLGVVAYAANDLRVEPVPLRKPAADETVVEVAYGGICGSDLHYWMHGAAGESILRAPMVLGHEVVGTVAQAAGDGSGLAPGTLVAVHPATPAGDGVTRFPADRPNLSPACTYLGSAARFPHCEGAFIKYATLPSRMLRPLPAGLGLRDAALVEPASVAWHAVSQADNVHGRSALVIGAGPIGALIVAVLKRAARAKSPRSTCTRSRSTTHGLLEPHGHCWPPRSTRSPPCRPTSWSNRAATTEDWRAPSAARPAGAGW